MTRALIATLAVVLLCAPTSAQSLYPTDESYRAAFLARCAHVRAEMARQSWRPGEDGRKRIYLGVLKVATGTDQATGLKYLRDAIADRTPWTSFETYAFMDAVRRLGRKLPTDLVAAVRQRAAASFTSDFGFTDNHRLQYRTARYLFGQIWPDGPTFADGMSPAEARGEAREWIVTWIDDAVSRGMYEYDSPNYHQLYLLCLATLHEFSDDQALRQKAWMMQQVVLVEWASEYLHGVWIGAHSREKYDQVTHTLLHPGAGTEFGPLFFGDSSFHLEMKEGFYVSLAALQAFEALPIVGRIATDRSRAFVQRELKPPRRGPGIINGEPTWKYDYVTPTFALGSSWGDLTDVENHRWDLTWVSKKDGATCFFINPSNSARQLIRYFETTIDRVLQEILRQRPYYSDPNKWVEGSPHEDVFQHENVLVAVYNIPPDETNQHINGFFPRAIDERREEGGWILCRANGVYFAVRATAPGVWVRQADYDRLTLRNPKTAIFFEVHPASDFASFDAFCARMRMVEPAFDPATLTATITSIRGDRVSFTHRGRRVVNGTEVRLADWPLFEGPWINARPGTRVITLQYGSERVVLDFNTDRVTHQRGRWWTSNSAAGPASAPPARRRATASRCIGMSSTARRTPASRRSMPTWSSQTDPHRSSSSSTEGAGGAGPRASSSATWVPRVRDRVMVRTRDHWTGEREPAWTNFASVASAPLTLLAFSPLAATATTRSNARGPNPTSAFIAMWPVSITPISASITTGSFDCAQGCTNRPLYSPIPGASGSRIPCAIRRCLSAVTSLIRASSAATARAIS
jgi:hypothetical protein